MDSLKDRVGGFTECTLIMACPVLLAVATKKVDLSSEGNAAVRHSISPLAAVSLFLCSFAFIPLGIASALKTQLPANASLVKLVLLPWKLLVHVSAILQMVLAYMILRLITMKMGALVAWLVVLCLFVFVCAVLSAAATVRHGGGGGGGGGGVDWNGDESFNEKLELSLDFSGAVTSLIFLGLEGMALEGQTSVGKRLNPRLVAPVGVTFCCCVLASAGMILATVPPIDHQDGDRRRETMCKVLHIFWAVLTICLTVVVLMVLRFVFERQIIDAFIVAGVPWLVLLVVYIGCVLFEEGRQEIGGQLKPASLEMTKVTFTGFLAVSLLPSFRDGHLSRYFIGTIAMSVIFGLGWRLFTQINQKAAAWTANLARVCTHGCLAAAVIQFMLMAMRALSG